MTDLLITVAWARGRLHVKVPPRRHPPGEPWDARAHAISVAARCAAAYAEQAVSGARP